MSHPPSRITRRQGLKLSAAAAWSAAASSATWAAGDTTTLQVVAPWEIGGLDPSKTGYVFTRLEVSETLVGVDEQGQLVGMLASRWSVAANQLSWRFELRAGARFHDGSPVSAADVVRSLERARANPGVLGNAPIQRIAADGAAVVIELARPFAPLAAFLAHSSTQVLAAAAYASDGSVRELIGSGPYRIVKVQPPQKMELERFALWTGPKPAIARVAYLAVSRGETRQLMASSGQADLVFTHDPANYARLATQKNLRLHSLPIPRSIYLKVNAGHPALRELATRQALSLAIDRNGIATTLLRSPKAAATQLFAPGMAEWHVPSLTPLTRDLEQARALLRTAGWSAGPDGMMRRDGKPLKLALRTFSDRPELPVMASAIQAQWREIGVDLAVEVMNSGEIPAGHKNGSLELALLARNYALVPDPVGTLLQDFGPTGGDWGAMNWSSATVRDGVAALASTDDPRRRSALRGSIATVLQAELPVIPVAWYQHTATSSNRLAQVSIDPMELSYRIARMRWASPA